MATLRSELKVSSHELENIDEPLIVTTTDTVTDVYDKTVTVGTGSFQNLFVASDEITTDFDILVVQNLDDTNFINLALIDEGTSVFVVKVPAGKFFILYDDAHYIDDDSDTESTASSLLDKITAQADTAAVQVRILAFT